MRVTINCSCGKRNKQPDGGFPPRMFQKDLFSAHGGEEVFFCRNGFQDALSVLCCKGRTAGGLAAGAAEREVIHGKELVKTFHLLLPSAPEDAGAGSWRGISDLRDRDGLPCRDKPDAERLHSEPEVRDDRGRRTHRSGLVRHSFPAPLFRPVLRAHDRCPHAVPHAPGPVRASGKAALPFLR